METEDKECVCDVCKDTGVVITTEAVYADDQHVAPIGERVCDCQLDEEEDWRVNE